SYSRFRFGDFSEATARSWRIGRWREARSRIRFCPGRRTLHELDLCKGRRFATTARQLILPTRYSVRTVERNSARYPPAPNHSRPRYRSSRPVRASGRDLPEPECSRSDWEGPEEGVDIECYEEEDSEGEGY